MKIQEARNSTAPVRTLVSVTDDVMPKGALVHPYAPFEGVDGNAVYKLRYPTKLNTVTNSYAFALGLRAKGIPQQDYYPGFLLAFPWTPDLVCNALERVLSDAMVLGKRIYSYFPGDRIPKHLPEAEPGTVWIKALKAPDRKDGIIFMVKHEESGRWLHKPDWKNPPKVVVRKLGVKSKLDEVMDEFPDFKARFDDLSEENQLLFRKTLSDQCLLLGSVLEDTDNAPYYAFYKNADKLTVYKPLWVIRISE